MRLVSNLPPTNGSFAATVAVCMGVGMGEEGPWTPLDFEI